MKILIIGGTGWVGHQLAGLLVQAGHQVCVTSRGVTSRYPMANGVVHIKADRGNLLTMQEVMATSQPEVVIDMGPQPSAINGIIDLCIEAEISHYLHCSSTGVYVPLSYLPADEEHPWERDTGVNFVFKVHVDQIALKAFSNHGFPATVLRPCYIQGEGMLPLDGLGGRYREYWQRVASDQSVLVPDQGQMLLQPVYAPDVARSFVDAINHREQALGQVFNITGDTALPLGRHIQLAIEAWGAKSKIDFVEAKNFTCDYVENFDNTSLDFRFLCEHMCLSSEKAKRLLGWRPQVSLEECLARTIAWAKENT